MKGHHPGLWKDPGEERGSQYPHIRLQLNERQGYRTPGAVFKLEPIMFIERLQVKELLSFGGGHGSSAGAAERLYRTERQREARLATSAGAVEDNCRGRCH